MRITTMHRRQFLAYSAATATSLATALPVRAAEAPKELRIGYQKAGILALAKLQRVIEKQFAPLGTEIRWAEFPYGPPLLEALNAGSLDYGYTGNAPPVFAQAARANLAYVAAIPARGDNQAIVVAPDSPLKTLADLRGKKIGVAKGSSAHDLLVSAIESANLTYKDINPIYLPPADAASAFAKGAIDAWSIWDPFLAIIEQKGVRRLPIAPEVAQQNSFFLANKDFLAKYPQIVASVNARLGSVAAWAKDNRAEAAKLFSEVTGVDLAAQTLSVNRTQFDVAPLNDEIVRQQQAVADRFFEIGLIPKKVAVADIVWKWTPGS
jgi:sulfonate transport system substrate-binding protein